MLQKHRVQRFGLALVVAGALSVSTWTGAEARPFGLLLGGGLHHLGGIGAFHPLGGFRPPGFGRGFYGGAVGFRQAGFGYPGFRQAGPGYRGYSSVDVTRGWRNGPGRDRYRGAYAAPLAVGAMGAYAYGYPRTDSDNNGYPASGYYGYPAYRY
jgi:hypothetical protein